ncbi:MAG: peptidylprolyl isomerase [Flavobacteriales bacterium]|nr:peptidylprolyl isomerase [Flavobacteriales bacterium]
MKLIITAVLTCLTFAPVLAQVENNSILMVLDGQKVTKSEFQHNFQTDFEDSVVTPALLDRYVQRFIEYKLKVHEAEELGYGDSKDIENQMTSYRKKLARTYLTDNEIKKFLLKEAYNRMTEEVRASHLLIKLKENATPADTLQAFKRILELRKRILSGEDFGNVAQGEGGSEDPSVEENKGDLGYFTAFQMVYPFESAGFNTPVGKLSMPVRTQYGYHIVKVTDKRSARGKITVAHILVLTKENDDQKAKAKAKEKIDSIYNLLNADNFSKLARLHSEDKSSAKKGGELPKFGTGRMATAFEDHAFALAENGQVSKPFKTKYGWHIVKRLDHERLESFESLKPKLEKRIDRDGRTALAKSSFIKKSKQSNGYRVFPKAWKAIDKQMDSTIFRGTWSPSKPKKLKKTLCKFNGKKYTQKNFVDWLVQNQKREWKAGDATSYVREYYQTYITEIINDFETSRLKDNNIDFRRDLSTFREGLLLFIITDEKVWRKSTKDKKGLEQYYDQVKENYMWDERMEATLYSSADEETSKVVQGYLDNGMSYQEIMKLANEDQLQLIGQQDIYEKGKHSQIDSFDWKVGRSASKVLDGRTVFIVVTKLTKPEPKSLYKVRGPLTTAYQSFLNEEWIKSLKAKYSVTVNKDVLYSIK